MISNWLSTALARRNIHYGWAMVAVTFFTALVSAGTVGEFRLRTAHLLRRRDRYCSP